METVLETREVHESWMIFKDQLLQAQEWSILMSSKWSRGDWRCLQMNKQLLIKLKHKRERYRRWKQSQMLGQEYQGSARTCRDG